VGVSTAEARVVTDRWLRPLGWATLVSNAVLVVTGGAVRLTGSGLGCPTWPRCTDQSFTPHGALDVHTAIEFGNRTLTFVLVAVAVATFLATLRSSRRDLLGLSVLLALGIPAQAVVDVRIGGEIWSARLYAPGPAARVGATVDILAIDGATALVLPLPDDELEAQ